MAKKTNFSFAGSIPENYDKHLGPLLFEPYGRDLVNRVPNTVNDVLELACGTGIVTQMLRDRLNEGTRLVATDLSEGMIDIAKKKTFTKKVEWKAVDATSLPFKDNSFDVVVCQFGVMFFPDKEKAAKEVFRVLRPGGRYLFNVWDAIKHNEFPNIIQDLITKMFDGEPPQFYSLPFGYYNHFDIRTTLRNAGFTDIGLTTVTKKLQADPASAAMGFIEGNPIANEIRDRFGKDLTDVLKKVENELAAKLGQKIAKGEGQAIVCGGRKAGELASNGKAAVHATEPATKPKRVSPGTPSRTTAKAKPKPKAKARSR